ncbi:MAG: response regulator transcription factor [Chitinophagaceae bacterium]|nr:response regulator transcription factor [Chitinophagaceae bacterium]
MKINCLLVDDEPLALKVLENHIESIPHLQVIASCANAFTAMQVLQVQLIDLMFLDVQLPTLMGTSFLKTLRNPPKVIFTTAYKEYAVEAFELDAVDYLLKPVTLERLIKAVNKISKEPIPVMSEEQKILEQEGFAYFRSDRKMIKVRYDDILFIESMKDYVKVMRTMDKPLLVKQSISSLENMLPANQFVRIHRSFIVSIQKITAFTNHDIEIGGVEIPIGRLYIQHLERLQK